MSRWKESFRWKWEKEEHINILESAAVVTAIRHKCRRTSAWGKRHLVMVDSQVALGALTKGRSSRPGVNLACRRLGALSLAHQIKLYMRWVPTKRNLADGPSRGFALGVAPTLSEEAPPLRLRTRQKDLPKDFRDLTG
jgi:hypothetical protein